MSTSHDISRRSLVKAGAAATAVLGAPGLLLAQAKPVKIGLVHPVSGGLAYSGAQARLGALMAIEEINAAGGIKAMGGAKLEGLLSDSQSRPEVGVSEVERLHQEGVSAYMGCFASGIALPATQAAAKYNTPFLIDVGASDLIVNRGLKAIRPQDRTRGRCQTGTSPHRLTKQMLQYRPTPICQTLRLWLEVRRMLPQCRRNLTATS